jgi:hypothetical protein
MANRKPLTIINGILSMITSPDLIDPSILPTSSGSAQVPQVVPGGTTFDIPAGTYQVAVGPIELDGTVTCEGELMIL